MKIKLILALGALAAQLAPDAALAQRRSAEPFARLQFNEGPAIGSNIQGQVGHHLSVAQFRAFEDDFPVGNRDPDTCIFGTTYLSHTGEMPPGVQINAAGFPIFAGTPRQPGTWDITVNVAVGCTAGPDQTRYERQVAATFTIQP